MAFKKFVKTVYSNNWARGICIGVIAGLILDLVIGLDIWNILKIASKETYIFFAQNIELQLWILIVLCLLPFGITVLILFLIAFFENPNEPEWLKYTTDTIFGVPWYWSYRGHVVSENSLYALCPHCFNRLEFKEKDIFGPAAGTSLAYCDNCGFKNTLEFMPNKIQYRVIKEIDRLTRIKYLQE
jgi:hypothetical protein